MNELIESLNIEREDCPFACSIEYSIADRDVAMSFLQSFVYGVFRWAQQLRLVGREIETTCLSIHNRPRTLALCIQRVGQHKVRNVFLSSRSPITLPISFLRLKWTKVVTCRTLIGWWLQRERIKVVFEKAHNEQNTEFSALIRFHH